MPTIQIKALSKGAGFVAFCALLTLRSGGRPDYLRAGAPLVQTLFSDAFDADLLREAFATFSIDERGREVSVFRSLTIQTPKEGVKGLFEPDEAAQSILQASDEELYCMAEALLGCPRAWRFAFLRGCRMNKASGTLSRSGGRCSLTRWLKVNDCARPKNFLFRENRPCVPFATEKAWKPWLAMRAR